MNETAHNKISPSTINLIMVRPKSWSIRNISELVKMINANRYRKDLRSDRYCI
jgi:hypothetical protein